MTTIFSTLESRFTPPSIPDRLPHIGTTIFTLMSQLASEHQAVNLGQGFPDFACDPALVDAVTEAMRAGHNQYPPMAGVPLLRERVADKIRTLYGGQYDPTHEITITAGATQAILTAILAVVSPGDEVIVLEPCYDSYEPNITLAGGKAIYVPLAFSEQAMTFTPDFDRIQAAISPRTRAIIVNSPHNPSGASWSADDMRTLEQLLIKTDIILIADEVYEHMVYDGAQHQSVCRYPQLASRSFVVSSFGKTFHVTGWKVGYVAAPASLTALFRKVHQFNVFTVNTPAQLGIAHYLRDPAPYIDLPAFYQAKRDLFRDGLKDSKLELLSCPGTYFQTVRFRQHNAGSQNNAHIKTERAFCEWLTREVGVAAIPLSAFYHDQRERQMIRFCFAKKDETLHHALEKLQSI